MFDIDHNTPNLLLTIRPTNYVGNSDLYTESVEEKIVPKVNKTLIPGWYEWFSDNESKTHVSYIAQVQENGGIFLPEVTTTYVQFHNAVDQGRAHRMVYADRSDISEPVQQKIRMALALSIISDQYPGLLDKDILKNNKYVDLADHLLDLIKTIEEVNR
jgi:predicted DNA binding protein